MDAAARWNRTMSRLRAIGVSHYGAGRIFGSGRTNKDEERRSARVLTPDRSHANPRPPERAREPIGCAASSHRKRPSPLSLGPRRPAGPARSPSLPRFLSRLPRAAARRALAALLLAGAGTVAVPAWADVLVSNIGQTRAVDWELASLYDLGQPFTTGSNVWGYTLSSIELRLDTSTGTTPPTVKVFSGSASGTEVAALSAPANLDASTRKNYTFTASGTVKLNASTTYWVVAEGGSNDVHWSSTASDSEDGTPATGWSVGDTGVLRNASETGSFQDNVLEYAMLIRVNGATITAPAVASAEVTAAKPKELVLTFDDALDTDSVPAASAFSVEIDGSAGPAVSSVAIDGDDATKLTLGLSVALTAGDSNVTVDYTQPASNPLQDAAENKVASFTGQDVTNNAAACPSGQPSAAFWTGCLTVGGTSPSTGLGLTSSDGALSDTTFTYDSTNYTIDRLTSWRNTTIDLSLTSDPRPGSNEWVLRVGSVDLPTNSILAEYQDTPETFRFDRAHTLGLGFGKVPLWSAGDKVSVSLWRNRFPVLENPIPDQTAWVGQAFSFQVPANTFSDPEGHALEWLSARLPDEQALPAWLTFDRATGTFTGEPASGDAGTLSVTVNIVDAFIGVAEATFDLVVRAPADLRLSSSSVAVTEGSEATYTVALAEAPHADVTVTVESDDTGAATVSPASLTFTTSNWNQAQTVTVTGVSDADPDDESVTITHSGTAVATATIDVTVEDDGAFSGALVSNLGVSTSGEGDTNIDRAQVFTTGSHAGGYVLTSVRVDSDDDEGDSFSVSVCTVGSNGFPTSTCTALTAPGSFAAGIRTFTAPTDTVLAADTSYAVVIDSNGDVTLDVSRSNNQSGLTGWSIADNYHLRDGNSWRTFGDSSLRIAIQGNTKPTPTPTGVWSATLSVKDVGGSAYGCNNGTAGARCRSSSVLTDDDFTVDGTTYGIIGLFWRQTAKRLELVFDKDLQTAAQKLSLDVDGTVFAFEDADVKSTTARGWNNAGLSWSTNDTVALSLSETPNAAPTASDGRLQTPQGEDYTFAASDFGFSDTDTGDALASVKVLTRPGSGRGKLKLDGTTISSSALPKTVTKDELDNDKLVYEPAQDMGGAGFATFNFKVNDGDDDSARTYTMTIDVRSSISVSHAKVEVDEGSTATYTVALGDAPTGSVTVAVASGDTGAATVAPSSLTFTAVNWATPQEVTVTGVEDADLSDESVTITHSATGFAPKEVEVAVNDDDCPSRHPTNAFWSGCLTVGKSSDNYGYSSGFGSLSDTSFSLSGTNYTISGLSHNVIGGVLKLTFGADPGSAADDWILQVGVTSLALGDAQQTGAGFTWGSSLGDASWVRARTATTSG